MDLHCKACGVAYGTGGKLSHVCCSYSMSSNAQEDPDLTTAYMLGVEKGKDAAQAEIQALKAENERIKLEERNIAYYELANDLDEMRAKLAEAEAREKKAIELFMERARSKACDFRGTQPRNQATCDVYFIEYISLDDLESIEKELTKG